jgi:SSS family solute:Na+ symporter
MAQNFWTAIYAWTVCFLVTAAISLVTRAHAESGLEGLVYSLTRMPGDEGVAWYLRPGPLGAVIMALVALLNVIFW